VDSKQFDKAMTMFTLGCVLMAVVLVVASSFYFDTKWRPTEDVSANLPQ